jgi:hypothetical protein
LLKDRPRNRRKMPDRFLAFFLCLLFAFFSAAAESAQEPARGVPDDDDEEAVQPAQPEPPKQTLIIEVKDDLLSVELANVDFGTVIRQIAGKAGFKVEGSGEVFSRKLNTKFTNVGIERGIVRLLTLVKETNYTLHYDTQGAISRLELFPASSVAAPSGTRPPQRPLPPQRVQPSPQPQAPARPSPVTPTPIPQRPAIIPSRPPAAQPRPVQPQVLPDDDDEDDEEDVNEVPYIAPQPRQPIMPRRGR